MTERGEAAVLGQGPEATEPPPSDVLEKDPLDRILCAEGEDLVELRLNQRSHVM